MTWKYALHECKMHVLMSVLCLVQVVLLFSILIGMISIFMKRYAGYRPVQHLVEQDGYVCNVRDNFHLDGDAESRPIQNSETYEEMLKDASVCGQYSVSAFVDEPREVAQRRTQGGYNSNVWAYDDGWIQGYVPKMQSGSWLQTHNTQGECLEAVVLQSTDKYQKGDVAYVDTNSATELKTKIPVKIVGIIDRQSDFIYHSNPNKSIDYHMLFSNMGRDAGDPAGISYVDSSSLFLPETFFVAKTNLDSVQEQYVDQEAEDNLSENYEKVPTTSKVIFGTYMEGIQLITMKKGCSQELAAYNKNRIAQISEFDFLHDLSYIKKNTWHSIMANISNLIPVGVGMILFSMISFVTLSTLMYQKNRKKYSIFYMCGLTGHDIFHIHMRYILLIIVAALILGILLIYGVSYFGIWSNMTMQIGVVQIVCCLMVMLLLLLSSALMCLSFLQGRATKHIKAL